MPLRWRSPAPRPAPAADKARGSREEIQTARERTSPAKHNGRKSASSPGLSHRPVSSRPCGPGTPAARVAKLLRHFFVIASFRDRRIGYPEFVIPAIRHGVAQALSVKCSGYEFCKLHENNPEPPSGVDLLLIENVTERSRHGQVAFRSCAEPAVALLYNRLRPPQPRDCGGNGCHCDGSSAR